MSDTTPSVRDAMTPVFRTLDEDQTLASARAQIETLPTKAAPVIGRDGRLRGVLVKQEALAALGSNGGVTVGEVCRNGASVNVGESIDAALQMLRDAQMGRIPVVDGDGLLVGEVSAHDIRQFMETQRAGSDLHARSKVRWRTSGPTPSLTWGTKLSGDAFIVKAESYAGFTPEKAVLEIGPGYGRLLRAVLDRGLPFRRYVAVDISPTNVRHLTRAFPRDDLDFMHGDIETVSFEERFDIVLSSLTFKHFYPSFERAVRNVARHLTDDGHLIFDLIEERPVEYRPDVDFMRGYSRAEVQEMLQQAELGQVTFDEVEHAPGWVRLLVVARKA